MHSESDNIQIMINDEADEVIKNFFDTLKNRPPNNLESMKVVRLSPDWIKNKKATVKDTINAFNLL